MTAQTQGSDTPEDEAPRFEDLQLSDTLKQALREVGYIHATPVQQATLEPAQAGKDLVVQARTGTGKTAAFALPLMNGRVDASQPTTQALILTPTRELALQVQTETERLGRHTPIKVCPVYGGAPMGRQIDDLARGAHIVVGTPGRVLDHLERRTLNPKSIKAFVLDECDEMLSMGFLPQITAVWEQLPKGHQTLLFSATIPKEVLRIAETRLSSPEMITLSGDHIGALEIQHFVYLTHGDKLSDLMRIIDIEDPESAIVFCNTRDETKRVTKQLQQAGYTAEWLNADLAQGEREHVMAQIRGSELRFLVCTDVAARGIDISHLTHVINFDFPESSEQYVHRTGRTGRAGKMGTALSLVTPEAIGNLYYLRLKYRIQPIERHLPTKRELETRAETDLLQLLQLELQQGSLDTKYGSLARRLLTHDHAERIIGGLLQERFATRDDTEARTLRRQGRLRRQGSAAESGEAKTGPDKPGDDAPPHEGTKARGRRRRRGPEDSDAGNNTARGDKTEKHPPRRGENGASRRSSRTKDPTYLEDEGIRYSVSDAEPASAEQPEERSDKRVAVADRAASTTPMPNAKSDYINLFVNVGRRDGATLEILKTALEDAGVQHGATGRIAIRERHSFVEVRPDVRERVIDKLNGTKLCGREAVVELARPRT